MKVADDVVVGLMGKATAMVFDHADDVETVDLQGARIPFSGLRSLIKMK